MHTFNAHAATDITGFGILGHAQNLARQQRTEVSFVIHNLPVLAKMAAVSKACGNMFGLMHGTCPETSGIRFMALFLWFMLQAHRTMGGNGVFLIFYLLLPRRRFVDLSSSWASCPFLRRDQISQIRRGSSGVDHRHRGERQPHGTDHRQTPHHRSRTAGGHAKRQHHPRNHVLILIREPHDSPEQLANSSHTWAYIKRMIYIHGLPTLAFGQDFSWTRL